MNPVFFVSRVRENIEDYTETGPYQFPEGTVARRASAEELRDDGIVLPAMPEELADTKGKVKYFEGTPIPTSVLIVLVLAVLYALGKVDASLPFGSLPLGPWTLHPFVLIYAASGFAMVSRIKIPKL